jgi:hypothetical protein
LIMLKNIIEASEENYINYKEETCTICWKVILCDILPPPMLCIEAGASHSIHLMV